MQACKGLGMHIIYSTVYMSRQGHDVCCDLYKVYLHSSAIFNWKLVQSPQDSVHLVNLIVSSQSVGHVLTKLHTFNDSLTEI